VLQPFYRRQCVFNDLTKFQLYDLTYEQPLFGLALYSQHSEFVSTVCLRRFVPNFLFSDDLLTFLMIFDFSF